MQQQTQTWPGLAQAQTAIIQAGQRLYQRGLVAANDGNISCRLAEGPVLLTPSGVSKGFLTAAMLLQVNEEGKVAAGDLRPSSEMWMHLELYAANPQIGAVVHAHPPVATAFACCGLPLSEPVLPEAVVHLGPVPLAPYQPLGSRELARQVATYANSHFALLLANHGAVVWGRDVEQALFRMETLEQYARIIYYTRGLGGPQKLTPAQVEALEQMRR